MSTNVEDQYAEFYDHAFGRLERELRYLVGPDAEDVAQEALLIASRRWADVGSLDLPAAWVRRVALRIAARRANRERDRPTREAGFSQPRESLPLDLDLVAALLDLPDRSTAAIRLHHLHDRPIGELAAVLGCSEGAAKVLLHRARRVLAERFIGLTGRWVSERRWTVDGIARHLRQAGWDAQVDAVIAQDFGDRGGRWELSISDGSYALWRDDGARFDHGVSRTGRSTFEMAPTLNTGRARYAARVEGPSLSLRFLDATIPPHLGMPEGAWAGIFFDAAPFVRADTPINAR